MADEMLVLEAHDSGRLVLDPRGPTYTRHFNGTNVIDQGRFLLAVTGLAPLTHDYTYTPNDWVANTGYLRNAYVRNAGTVYKCNLTHVSPNAWDGVNWVAQASAVLFTLKRLNVEIEVLGGTTYKAVVTYGIPDGLSADTVCSGYATPLDRGFSMSAGVTTQHVVSALEVVSSKSFIVGKDPPNYGTLIAPDIDGNPIGVDIYAPTGRFSITKILTSEELTAKYMRDILAIRATTNKYPFFFCQPGEALFLGPDLISRPPGIQGAVDGGWNVVYNFEYQPHQYNIPVGKQGNTDVFIDKKGHEAIAKTYTQGVTTAALESKVYKLQPLAVYVYKLFRESDFSVLGPWVPGTAYRIANFTVVNSAPQQATLNWDAFTGALAYNVYNLTPNGAPEPGGQILIGTVNTPGMVINGLASGTYCFLVTAVLDTFGVDSVFASFICQIP